jgi:hypothetical protein
MAQLSRRSRDGGGKAVEQCVERHWRVAQYGGLALYGSDDLVGVEMVEVNDEGVGM